MCVSLYHIILSCPILLVCQVPVHKTGSPEVGVIFGKSREGTGSLVEILAVITFSPFHVPSLLVVLVVYVPLKFALLHLT